MRLTPWLRMSILPVVAILPGLAGAEDRASGKLRVLVVTGGHDYDQPAFERMFAADEGLECRHQAHPQALETITSAAADAFDAIVLYDLYQPITEAQRARYAALVRGGKGLVALHHSMASFQDWPEYERMIGGKFLLAKDLQAAGPTPPSGYLHDQEIPVEVADPDHFFITRGLKDFVIHDETYSQFRVDPAAQVLLRTRHPRSGPVIGWALPYGKARVVCLQLGHDDAAYSNPAYRTLVSRAIRWVARRSPEDAEMRPIFNGRDLSGWKTDGQARFTVEDGMLLGRQGPGAAAGDLFTETEYGDFELEATWAMEWPGNSGLWFRYQDADRAYQADILEWKSPVCWSGSVYCPGEMFISMNLDPGIVRRDGWNTFVVRAVKDHLRVWLNGRMVSDVHESSSPRGRIGFQVHPGAEFARMAIRIADVRLREAR